MASPPIPGGRSASTHQPINATSTQIRLLSYQINEKSNQIRCRLTTCSLDDPTRLAYRALSYIWGDAKHTRPIIVNGIEFEATKNLCEALKGISSIAEQPDYLWVDAICIDQAYVQERTHQVALMSRIYKEASNVYTWLEPAGELSPKAMSLVKCIGRLAPDVSSM